MVKVQLILRLAQTAFATVTLPDFELHCGWNNSSPLCVDMDRLCQIIVALHSNEPKLKYCPVIVALLP